jgi:hypothetical protein
MLKPTIDIELFCEGETEPIEVVIEGFEIDGDAIRITDLRASRPWIEKLLKSFVAGRPFDLPPQIAKLLKALF